MEHPRWSSGSTYGIMEIEQLHPVFFAELRKLASMPDGEFEIYFNLFIAKLESDFRTEEQWMEDIGFASLREHRAQHAEALSVLHQVQALAFTGDVRLARRVLELLPEWFVDHVLTMDVSLANALRSGSGQHRHVERMLAVV